MKPTPIAMAAALACAMLSQGANAQESAASFPSRAIHIIVPYTPGAINDILARRIAQKLGEELNQTVIVENKPGAGTAIGTDYVARSAPDGYVLLQAAAAHSINAALMSKLPYDSIKDFQFITLVGTAPYVMIGSPSLPARDVGDFIKLAKADPGKYSYASTGIGGSAHLMGEMLNYLGKIDTVHIPYKGLSPAMSDITAGRVQISFSTYPGAATFLNGNKVKALGVTGKERLKMLPDVPAIGESVPGYDSAGWWGYLAPKGTPQPIVDKLNRAINKIVQSPEFRESFAAEGVQMLGTSPQGFLDHVQAEIGTWQRIGKAANIKLD